MWESVGMSERYNPGRYRRRSIRLRDYNYSSAGAYFLTLCAYNREMLFGEMSEGEMTLHCAGRIVADEWRRSAKVRAEIELDEWIVMPNHLHGIVIITGGGLGMRRGDRPVAPTGPKPKSIGALIAGFKSATTKRINAMRGTPGSLVWQRGYYDHVVRGEAPLKRIRQYIRENPLRWDEDPENPVVRTSKKQV